MTSSGTPRAPTAWPNARRSPAGPTMPSWSTCGATNPSPGRRHRLRGAHGGRQRRRHRHPVHADRRGGTLLDECGEGGAYRQWRCAPLQPGTRAAKPLIRSRATGTLPPGEWLRHIGLYGYRVAALPFAALPAGRLEQSRRWNSCALEAGWRIAVALAPSPFPPAIGRRDLARAERSTHRCRSPMAGADRDLMVCMGSICRSPMAEGALRARLEATGLGERARVDSAGASRALAGQPPDERAIACAARRGVAIRRSAHAALSVDDFDAFDFILCADRGPARCRRSNKPRTAWAGRAVAGLGRGGAQGHCRIRTTAMRATSSVPGRWPTRRGRGDRRAHPARAVSGAARGEQAQGRRRDPGLRQQRPPPRHTAGPRRIPHAQRRRRRAVRRQGAGAAATASAVISTRRRNRPASWRCWRRSRASR